MHEDTHTQGAGTMQEIPVKMYCSEERLTVAAPMPGLQPEDIAVAVDEGNAIVLHGDLRGVLKGEKDVLCDEWNPGPYHRELTLPECVDGERANVTYNNGVLVVVLPRADRTTPATLRLDGVGPAKGARVGNQGKDMMPPERSN
jgi:HSP20 family protein